MKSNEELLTEYAKEIGLENCFTLQNLIDSHRRLRDMSKDYRENIQSYYLQAIENGKKLGYQTVLEQEYISVEKLKKMTLIEIVGYIEEDE